MEMEDEVGLDLKTIGRGRGRGRALKIHHQTVDENEDIGPTVGNVSRQLTYLKFEDRKEHEDGDKRLVLIRGEVRNCNYKDKDSLVKTRKLQFDWPPTSSSRSLCSHLDHPNSEFLFQNRYCTPSERNGLLSASVTIHSPPQQERCQKPKPVIFSNFLPKYFEASKPSSRLRTLKTSTVKILKVLDNMGSCMVAFQDEDSLNRFECLLQHMSSFYTTPEGYALKKSGRFLEHGEIVAATVYTSDDAATFRRVKIQTIQRQEKESFKAYAVDIDNLTHWNIMGAFSLITQFYEFPSQACRIKVSNFNDIYPRGMFDVLFKDEETYHSVMNSVTKKLFHSLIGRTVKISNISFVGNDNEECLLTADIDLGENVGLETLYLECFRIHFIPKFPEEGTLNEGMISDVLPDGIVGICMKNSLSGSIDSILNGTDIQQLASQVCKETVMELLQKITTLNYRLFIAVNEENSRYVRVQVQSYYEDQLKVLYMDSGREAHINVKRLICTLTHNPRIHPILATVPAQALRFKLFGVRSLNDQQTADIYEKYRHGVVFKVVESQSLHNSITNIIFVEPVLSTFSASK